MTEKRKVIFLRGAPASGKSTIARQFCEENPSFLRVNRDSIKKGLDFYRTHGKKEFEELVSKIEYSTIKSILRSGRDVIIDNTNAHPSFLKDYFLNLFNESYDVSFTYINTPEVSVEECINRDIARGKEGEHVVGEAVVRKIYRDVVLNKDKFNNKFNELISSYTKHRKKIVFNENLPKCIIVDVDGTVADICDRGVFDFQKSCGDTPKKDTVETVRNIFLKGEYQVIFLTARPDDCKKVTENWLNKNFPEMNIFFSDTVWGQCGNNEVPLLMRKSRDFRKGFVVKKEIIEEISKHYNPVLALDDNDLIIDMFDFIGLKYLKVK